MRHFASYYDYELTLAKQILIPFLHKQKICLDGKRVLDVGCGAGGFLNALAGRFRLDAIGVDYDEEMLAQCQPVAGVRLQQANFLAWNTDERFDLILLRDVLEHCDRAPEMLARATRLLTADGLIYATYSPYFSPFGGHQHNRSGIFSKLPYLHVLPESLYWRLLRVRGNLYKSERYLIEDLKQIRRTCLTTGAVKACCQELGLQIRHRQVFLVRPDYRYKFGLPTVPLPNLLPLGTCCDPFCTSVELLLEKGRG
jgi:SAM-dependent methyltransferase